MSARERLSRRALLGALPAGAGVLVGATVLARCTRSPLRVGVLHSLSGTMALSERGVLDATLLGLEEVNARGGLLGRRVEPVVRDGRSDAAVFAREAEALVRGGACVVFGCWTSASRRNVVPVIERLGHLLVYPLQYEGLEQSPNVVYTGAAPNQQITPAVAWALASLGRRFFLVGSDYVFPRTANAIVRDQLVAVGAELAGEMYLPLGSRDVAAAVRAIAAAAPCVVLNTINGDTNEAFFRALRAAGVTPARAPTISFSVAEPELEALRDAGLAGDFAAWNYFQSIDRAENVAWVRRFRARFGARRVTSDPMEAAWVGTQLWAQAVAEAGTADPAVVRRAMLGQSVDAPEGVVAVDAETGHCWKGVRIGRVRGDGQFELVWNSGRPARPVPFPIYRPREDWERFLREMYQSWGGRWSAP